MQEKIYCHICNTQTNYTQWSLFIKNHVNGKHKNNLTKKEYFEKYNVELKHDKKFIKCLICGDENYCHNSFGPIHLKIDHNMTSKEYYDMFLKKEGEGICHVCGKETNFRNINDGYCEHCSVTCARNNPNINEILREKRKVYVDNMPIEKKTKMIEHWKDVMSKKSKEDWNGIAEKYRKSMGEKSEEEIARIIMDMRKTKIKKYIDKIQDKLKENNLEFIEFDFNESLYVFKCKICNSIFKVNGMFFQTRMRNNTEVCLICNPYKSGFSSQEKKLLNFIKENYDKEIIENDRTVLSNNKELDIYLPDINLALEFNGLFWHSNENKSNDYHFNKTNETESNNIHLLQIYEDDWNFKNDIVKSNILKLLGKCGEINSNDLDLKEIDKKVCLKFLKQNSLYDNKNFDICLGLFDNKKLLYVACFKDIGLNNYELLETCDIVNYKINGALDKVLKYFIQKYNTKEIVSFSDRTWIFKNKSEYLEAGFKIESILDPDFMFIIKDKRRVSKNSDKIKEMDKDKLLKIYDSGKLKFIYTKDK